MKYSIIFRHIIGVIILLVLRQVTLAEPNAGELLVVKLDKIAGLELNFRYCPNGETFDGRPDAEGATEQSIKGFYIQETEMSIGDFIKLTNDKKIEEVKNRLVAVDKVKFDAANPIRGNIIEDITECCEKITTEDTLAQDTTTNIEKREYRLPTHIEWQYACRAVQSSDEAKKQPHFGVWGKFDKLPESVSADCNDIWQDKNQMNRSDKFTGTQIQFIEIVEYCQKNNKNKEAEKILQAFFKDGILNKRKQLDKPDIVREVNGEPENTWHIRGLHSNVKEWTQGGKNYYLDGGAFNEQVDSKSWQSFTVWGGEKQNFDASPQHDVASDRLPGFRLAMSRLPSVYWLLIIRQTLLSENDKAKRDTALSGHITQLKDLADDKGFKQMSRKVEVYKAIRKVNDNELDEKSLTTVIKQMNLNDDYFDYLNEIIENN